MKHINVYWLNVYSGKQTGCYSKEYDNYKQFAGVDGGQLLLRVWLLLYSKANFHYSPSPCINAGYTYGFWIAIPSMSLDAIVQESSESFHATAMFWLTLNFLGINSSK